MNQLFDFSASSLQEDAKAVPGFYDFLDPLRYKYHSFYPSWYTLPQSGSSYLAKPAKEKTFALYIHFPFCSSHCPGCLYSKVPKSDNVPSFNAYLDLMKQHLSLYENVVDPSMLRSVYIGGGTPSLMNAKEIHTLLKTISAWVARDLKNESLTNLPFLEEITFECHPSSFKVYNRDADKLMVLRELCGNKLRISLGIQSLQPKLCRFVRYGEKLNGDIYDKSELVRIVNSLIGVGKVNLDFMFGFNPKKFLSVKNELKLLEEGLKELNHKPSALTFYQLWHGIDRIPTNDTKEPRLLSERILDFEHRVEPILENRLQIWACMKELGYFPEVSSIYSKKGVSNPDCIYHTDYLYGNENVISVGTGSYAYWEGYAFMMVSSLNDYKRAIIDRKILPIGLGAYLSEAEHQFRGAILSFKLPKKIIDFSDIKGFLGPKKTEEMLNRLCEVGLAERMAAEGVRLTSRGYILADEIVSWFSSTPPLHERIKKGKSRIVDGIARQALKVISQASISSDDDYNRRLAKYLTSANEHLDEYIRRCWPDQQTYAKSRYSNCLCAVQSHKTNAPIFSIEHWCIGDERNTASLGLVTQERPHLSRYERYASARKYFDEAMKHSEESGLISIFSMFFSPPWWFHKEKKINSQYATERMAFLHIPPAFICHMIKGEARFGIEELPKSEVDFSLPGGVIDITEILRLLDHAISQCQDEPKDESDWNDIFQNFFSSNSQESKDLCFRYIEFIKRINFLRGGLWGENETERANLSAIKRRFDSDLPRDKGWLFATFCLYWALLKEYTDEPDGAHKREDAGKMILHIPYFSYDDQAQGGAVFFINGTTPLSVKEQNLLQTSVDSILTRFGTREVAKAEQDSILEAFKSRLRAGASGIMTRNFSHNIGSHVTPRTKVKDLRERVEELLLSSHETWSAAGWKNCAFPIIESLKDKLDEYIQRKAEFIAEYSTDPLISTRGAWFYRDIILPFICNTALIDSIAANEGFRYENPTQHILENSATQKKLRCNTDYQNPGLVLRFFRIIKGEPNEFLPKFRTEELLPDALDWPDNMVGAPYGMRHIDYPVHPVFPAWEISNDIWVALPGPVGEMAIYGILENIIRNAAKHGYGRYDSSSKTKKLEIGIAIQEIEDSYDTYKMHIWDNLSEVDNGGLQKKIQGYINKPIIDNKSGQLRNEAWGTAEMVLCANLLSGYTPEDELSVPCLRAPSPDQANELWLGKLKYELEISRAFIGVFFGWDERVDQKYSLFSRGFLFRPVASLKEKEKNLPLAMEFAIINAKKISQQDLVEIGENLHRLPFRIIMIGLSERMDEPGEIWLKRVARMSTEPPLENPDDLPCWLWKSWIQHLQMQSHPIDKVLPCGIDLYFQQERNDNPTNSWIEKANHYNNEQKNIIPIRVWGRASKGNFKECLTQYKNTSPGEKRIVFDRHGDLIQETGIGTQMNDCVCVLDKLSADFEYIFNDSFPSPWTLPYELAESGLIRILVIDERITQKASKIFDDLGAKKEMFREAFTGNSSAEAKVWHVARRAGVFIGSHIVVNMGGEANGLVFDIGKGEWVNEAPIADEKPFWLEVKVNGRSTSVVEVAEMANIPEDGESSQLIIEFSSNYESALDIDMVIIHRGVVDRLNEKFDKLGEGILDAIKRRKWLVVESGRGIPPEVKNSNDKFLTYSTLERAFRGGRIAKLELSRMVMSATRNKGAGNAK